MWGEIAGAAISAVGNIAGGLMGRSDVPGYVKWPLQHMVKDARKAGIHPLAALGSPIAQPGYVPANGGLGEAISGAAANLGSGVAAGIERKRAEEARKNELAAQEKINAPMRDLQMALTAAQIRNEEAQTAAILADAQRTTLSNQLTAVARSTGGRNDRRDPIPLLVEYKMPDGRTFLGPNPDIPELDQMAVPPMMVGSQMMGDAAKYVADTARSVVPAETKVSGWALRAKARREAEARRRNK